MARITVQGLEKHYNGLSLFDCLSFEVQPGMRLAVAGPNGGGKSTLLRILAGYIEPDAGQVSMPRSAMLGYVAQEMDAKILEQSLLAWVLDALPSWTDFWAKWEQAVRDENTARLEALAGQQAEFELRFGYNPDHRARAILLGLGFCETDFLRSLGELSGGWRERAKLARVLFQGADVLLLDEPTNHLDLEAIEWLENYLLAFRGTLVLVAHDRVLLEKVGTHVLFIAGGRTAMRKGTFSQFMAWEEEQAELRVREAAKLSDKIDSEMSYIRRFRVKARKSAQAQSKLKRVEKLEQQLKSVQEKQRATRQSKTLNFRLPSALRGDKVAVSCVELAFSYEQKNIWNNLSLQLFRGKKIALVAPNGAGKTTLLKLITGELTPEHGLIKLGTKTKIGYFSQHQTEILREESTVVSEIRRLCGNQFTEQELMGVLGLFLLGEAYFERKVAALSGGEKSRLVLASLFLSGANLLILDEPTNHLDLESRMGLITALKEYDGTLLFVGHDRYLLSEVAHEVWELTPKGLEVFLGGFAEYEAKRRANPTAKVELSAQDAPAVLEASNKSFAQTSKEEKRRMAESRNALYRKLKPLKANYETLEKKLDKAMLEQTLLEERMNDPASYTQAEEAIRLNSEYKGLTEWIDELMRRMALLEEQMQSLEAKREAL